MGIRRAAHIAIQAGIDPRRTARSLRGIGPYLANRRQFLSQANDGDKAAFAGPELYPCLADRYENSGVANGHYFHQDLLVAQWLYEAAPGRHIDVGSRIDGFVAHVAAFRSIEVLDMRPLRTSAANIEFKPRDITLDDPAFDRCTDSISCLHTLEHLGLGRYGDRVDYNGYRRGWENLRRMLQPNGMLYFSTPISWRQRIDFDAHRVFSVPYLMDTLIRPIYDVEEFAYVDDSGELHKSADPAGPEGRQSFGLVYGCGIFALRLRRDIGSQS